MQKHVALFLATLLLQLAAYRTCGICYSLQQLHLAVPDTLAVVVYEVLHYFCGAAVVAVLRLFCLPRRDCPAAGTTGALDRAICGGCTLPIQPALWAAFTRCTLGCHHRDFDIFLKFTDGCCIWGGCPVQRARADRLLTMVRNHEWQQANLNHDGNITSGVPAKHMPASDVLRCGTPAVSTPL